MKHCPGGLHGINEIKEERFFQADLISQGEMCSKCEIGYMKRNRFESIEFLVSS